MPCAVKSKALKAASYTALLLLFLWPAIYNGQPFFSPDTPAYIRGFDAGVVWLTGRTTEWTTWASSLHARQGEQQESPAEAAKSLQSPSFIIAGRSVSYGALLYLSELLGGLWASIVVQAALALAAVSLTLRHFGFFDLPKLLMTAGTLGLVSSLPFFASFLLPDIFAGLSILATANLVALGDRLSRWERIFWLAILAAAVIFHPTHLAIVVVLLGAAIVGWLIKIRVSSLGIMTLAFAATIGFASEASFAFVVKKVLNVEVSRPPVVMARIIADGPGAAYLRQKCPQAGLIVCEFVDRLVSNSDAFLWDTSGVYLPAQTSIRRILGDEQYRFAAAVLAYDPLRQIAASLGDAFQQVKMVGLSDFLTDMEEVHPGLPQVHAEHMAESRLWREEFPIVIFSRLTILVAALSFIFIGVVLLRHWKTGSTAQKLFCFTILLGQLANALICGALSGPHERYQARLTWLIPVAALLLYYETRAMAVRPRAATDGAGFELIDGNGRWSWGAFTEMTTEQKLDAAQVAPGYDREISDRGGGQITSVRCLLSRSRH